MIGFRLLFLASTLGAAGLACAEDAPPAPGSAPSPAPAATPAAAARKAPAPAAQAAAPMGPASPEIAAMLAASMPKYDPPKPAPKQPDEDIDLRDVDKPKNEIIRLPKFVVHGEKPPIFREQDLYSKSGLAKLALARYEGLSVVPFSPLNTPLAEQMYRDDARLRNIADLKDTADTMARGGDKDESAYILRQSDETYMSATRASDLDVPLPPPIPNGPGTPPSP